MKNNGRNKELFWAVILILIPLSGCAGMFLAGIPMDVDKRYPDFIGLKLTPVVYPAVVIKNADVVYIHMPHDQPYGHFIASVPEGTIITIDHVIRKYNVEDEVNDVIMGQVNVPGYIGPIAVGCCNGKKHETIDKCIDLTEYKIVSK